MAETVILLHGFTSTARAWDGVIAALDSGRYRPLALDLRGHGAARDRTPIGFEEVVADVLEAAPGRFALAGYSMGGRIALHVALAAPERVSALVLISTSPGIENDAERAARRAADDALADELEDMDITTFADRWAGQSLFADDPPDVAARAREDRLRNDPRALAAALRGLSTGRMPPLWDRLGELRVPTVVIAGERDPKFTAIARRMAAALPDARLEVVPEAGHTLPVEAPDAVGGAINRLAV